MTDAYNLDAYNLSEISKELAKFHFPSKKNMKNCIAQVDENGVVHLLNEDGQLFMMMTQTDYQAILEYPVQYLNINIL